VGVTGHRQLANPERVAAGVREALQRIHGRVASSGQTVVFTVVSPLAEGADQIVADEALKFIDTRLEVPLPLEPRAYLRHSFESQVAGEHFLELLDVAHRTGTVIDPPEADDADEAYEAVGRYVVESSDVVIAVYDGAASRGVGGTARIVELAKARSRPLYLVSPEGEAPLVKEPENEWPETFAQLRALNETRLGPTSFAANRNRFQHDMMKAADRFDIDPVTVRAALEWISPYYVRADMLAQKFQSQYTVIGLALFLLAAAAVTVVVAQIIFWPEQPSIVGLEIGFMLLLPGLLYLGRSRDLRGRWLASRFLAERFRSAPYLAMSGLGGQRPRLLADQKVGMPESWLQRAYLEVWARRPAPDSMRVKIDGLKKFLAEAWVNGQIDHHRQRSEAYRRLHEQLGWLTAILYSATLVAAVLHFFEVGGHATVASVELSHLFTFVAIVLPAFGGAVTGIRIQRELPRRADRYDQLVILLQRSYEELRDARDLEALQQVAINADEHQARHNRDWVGDMKFHDFELHV